MPVPKSQYKTDGNFICTKGIWHLGFFLFGVLFLIACSGKQHHDPPDIKQTDSLAPPKVTYLADLPDSLQPKVTFLDQGPEPVTKTFPIPVPSKTFIDKATGLPLPADAHGEGFFTHFSTEDGLANDYVHTSCFDTAGHLWLGTTGGGASRWDGESFTTFTTEHGLISNTVWSIKEDSQGNIWFTTIGGISRYDGRTFTNYTTVQGLPFNDVGRMQEDDEGNLWFTTIGGGVSRFDGKSFTNYNEVHGLDNRFVFSVEKDKNGGLWFGTRGGGVFRYDPQAKNSSLFSKFNGLPEWEHDIVYCMHGDRKGNMWIGTQFGGLFCYDGKDIKKYTGLNGLDCETINDIMEDRQGSMWFGTCKGLSQFRDSTFITYANEFDIENKGVIGISEDDSGNIWFGTGGGGVFRYEGKAITKFTSEPINTNVSIILEDHKGHLWFSTETHGLTRYDGKNLISFSSKQGIARDAVTFMTEDKSNRIWFSTYYGGGVGCLDFNPKVEHSVDSKPASSGLTIQNQSGLVSLTTYTTLQGLPFDAVFDIEEDRAGNLWFGTYGGGATRFDGKSFTTFTTKQGLATNEIFKVFEDSRGNIWFLYTGPDGMTVFDGQSFTHFTKANGLPNMGVWSIAEDEEGNLWFGSENGLILLRSEEVIGLSKKKMDREFVHTPTFETFSTKHGLPNNCINDVVSDYNGNVMICTNLGIALLQGGLKAFSTSGSIKIFNTTEGYPLRSISSMHRDREGVMWLVTNSDHTGLVRLDPDAIRADMNPPDLIFKSIKINNEPINWYSLSSALPGDVKLDSNETPASLCEEIKLFSRELSAIERNNLQKKFNDIRFDSIAKWYPIPINLVLPYRHNSLTIDFNAMVTAHNNLVKYQYMLEGYDVDWSPPLSNSTATFGNIHEGHYTFKVKAFSPEGVWGEPITYAFSVLPPLHRSWWAYTCYALFLLTILFYVYRYQRTWTIRKEREKVKQKQAILNERLRISRDLHDEVGSTLSGIAMYSHIAKEQIKTETKEVVFHSLDVMQESAGEMVNKLNDIVWLLNPEKAQLHQLVEKLEAYAEKMAEIKNIQVTTAISERISGIELPIEVRRNIYLIFKEAINNAVKHSQATSLHILVRDDDHTLDFILEDNGTGFDANQVIKGNGLDNMHNRANEIGAHLSLNSSPGKGTRLTLTCKLTG